MPEEAELHPIRRGCRGNRRLLPERLVSYKVPTRLAFRTAAQLPRRQARRRGFRDKSRRASGSVGALPRSSLTPPILIISFSRPRSHLLPPASQRNSIIVSSPQGRARRGSRAKKIVLVLYPLLC
jgi:hypothetical protein